MPYDPIARAKADAAAGAAQQALLAAQTAQADTAQLTWVDVSADTTATPGQRLSVNTVTRPVTITLPVDGGTVSLRDDAGTWGINPVTVFGDGVLIGGQSTFVLDAPGFQVTFSLVAGAWRYTIAYMHGAAA